MKGKRPRLVPILFLLLLLGFLLLMGISYAAGTLKSTDVIRHYDVTGKICPKYYVEHEDAWKKFRKDVKKEINRLKKKLK